MRHSIVRFSRNYPRLLLAACLLATGTISLAVSTVLADGGVSQGYTTTAKNIVPGTLMGVAGNTGTAEPANSHGKYQLLGLVADKPLIALNDGSNQVQIVVSGTSVALVSDLNGTIKSGDKIAASPITGIGMKATEAGQVVGIAQKDLSAVNLTTRTVTDISGKQHILHIGLVPIQVSVSYYAGTAQNSLNAVLPPFIIQTANGIAGNQVSPLRVITALLVLVFGFVIAGIMLQTAVRSGMISLGRNPLAKNILRRELLDILFTSVGVLLLTIVIIYILLKI